MRMKMSSPAYMLPKSRSDSDSGFEMNDTSSRIRLNAMISGAAMIAMPFVGGALGWNVNSLPKPIGPLILIEYKIMSRNTVIDMPNVMLTSVVGTTFRYGTPKSPATHGKKSTGIRSMRFMRQTQATIVSASGA